MDSYPDVDIRYEVSEEALHAARNIAVNPQLQRRTR